MTVDKDLYQSIILCIAGNYFKNPNITQADILRVLEKMRQELTEEWIKSNPKRIAELRDVYK